MEPDTNITHNLLKLADVARIMRITGHHQHDGNPEDNALNFSLYHSSYPPALPLNYQVVFPDH